MAGNLDGAAFAWSIHAFITFGGLSSTHRQHYICSTDAEIREQIRRTVIHEFGHYFGLDEEQLKDV